MLALAVLLAMACGLVVAGVAMWSVPASLVTAGVLLAVWACLFLLRVGDGSELNARAGGTA